jgi:hypothetical protein
MSRGKRIALSFVSAIVAELLVFAAISLRSPAGARLDGFLIAFGFALYFVIPCWVLSLPAVVLIDPINRGRLWTLAAIGILIGPATMLAFDLWMWWHHPTTTIKWPGLWDYDAAAISFVATILYLTLLKTSSGRRIQPST